MLTTAQRGRQEVLGLPFPCSEVQPQQFSQPFIAFLKPTHWNSLLQNPL